MRERCGKKSKYKKKEDVINCTDKKKKKMFF